MKIPRCIPLTLLSLAACLFANAQNGPATNDPIRLEWKDADGTTVPCQIFLPLHYDKTKKYPLVLCMHGAGNMKSPPYTARTAASDALLNPQMREKYPAFVVVPQTSTGWAKRPEQHAGVPAPANMPAVGLQPECATLKVVIQGLADMMKEYSLDADRVYVSGQSMGGVATWSLILHHPEVFAAAVPICGVGNPQEAAKIKCPVWVFHGAQDRTVPVQCSRDMVEAMKKAGIVEVKYTEYPEGNHDAWSPAWREAGLAPWLFSKRRGQK